MKIIEDALKSKKLALTIPWDEIEETAQEDIIKVLKEPFIKKLAIMPDVHAGFHLPIGGVALTDGIISPAYVGSDIGCGMTFLKVHGDECEFLRSESSRQNVFNEILERIPVGKGICHKVERGFDDISPFRTRDETHLSEAEALNEIIQSRQFYQFGTLGGGNHFIEIGENSKGEFSITIHSGSRNPGNVIAEHYIKKRGEHLSLSSNEGRAYSHDMMWALAFALRSRVDMVKSVLEALGVVAGKPMRKTFARLHKGLIVKSDFFINENHNHATVTRNGVLHRKGATPAELGQYGVIPANQKDGVWITEGLGSDDYLQSASHGAGRTMSRRKAREKGSVEMLKSMMDGIIARTDEGVLDESPWAYKPIDKVLKAQDGVLVNVIDHFKPLIVVKG